MSGLLETSVMTFRSGIKDCTPFQPSIPGDLGYCYLNKYLVVMSLHEQTEKLWPSRGEELWPPAASCVTALPDPGRWQAMALRSHSSRAASGTSQGEGSAVWEAALGSLCPADCEATGFLGAARAGCL